MAKIALAFVFGAHAITADIDMDALFSAIAEVESNRGATSANVFQLRPVFVMDVNRISGLEFSHEKVASCYALGKLYMRHYWQFYGGRYYAMTGEKPTEETLARIHNGGPDGWMKPQTLVYWKRVEAVMRGTK